MKVGAAMLMDLEEVKETAKRLAQANADAEPGITEIWFFPDDKEVRLVEFDPLVPPDDEILPFHFPPDPVSGLYYPIAIALANPDDRNLPPPEGWVAWDKALRVYRRELGGGDELE